MAKRIFKIIGIVMLAFVVLAGGSIGIFALTGGFKTEEIRITKIYFQNETNDASQIKREQYTLTDTSFVIDCEPKNATNQKLKVSVQDTVGVLDNPPSEIMVGERVNLRIRKDAMGNNIGGPVTLEIRPESGLGVVTYTLNVDVAIPDNVLYFSGNATDKINTTGKSFTMAISTKSQPIYLRSDLTNAFYVQANNTNYKSADITYTYKDLNGKVIDTGSYTNMHATNENSNSYYYKIDVTPNLAGKIEVEARMHRTYEIEQEYKANNFDIITNLANPGEKAALLDKYNDFLNKYIEYFDDTEESYNFFKNYMDGKGEGKVLIPLDAFEKSKEYVYVKCQATINVTAVNLDNIICGTDEITYDVFTDNALYAVGDVTVPNKNIKNIITTFGLEVKVDNEDVVNDNEISNLLNTLSVNSYFYIDYNTYVSDYENPNSNAIWKAEKQDDWVDVYGFDKNNKPITTASPEQSDIIGYLIPAGDYNKYLDIKKENYQGKNYWQFNCNVPMLKEENEELIDKAIYVQFKVVGTNLSTNTEIVRESYTRVYINYDSYINSQGQQIKLAGEYNVDNQKYSDLKTEMALNSSLQGQGSSDIALSSQVVNIDETFNNYSSKQYKKVLYFVETNSNKLDNSQKVLTLGKYKFVGMDGAGFEFEDAELIGERLPVNNAGAYIQTLNAHTEPIKVFAVVCLTDKNGNPIDIYGRTINLKELISPDEEETINSIYVVASSYLSLIAGNDMKEIKINNYVDNINFYTKCSSNFEIGGVEFTQDSWIKRNNVDEYYDVNEQLVTGDDLEKIKDFLKIKLLTDYNFTLTMTNFEWDSSTGDIIDEDKEKLYSIKDINGSLAELTLTINVANNKQIALNNMCKNFERDFALSLNESIKQNFYEVNVVQEGENISYIEFKFRANAELETEEGNYIQLNPQTSPSVPYVTGIQDKVYYMVTKPEITNAKSGLAVQDQKLYARYSDGNANIKEFVYGSGNDYAKYELPSENYATILYDCNLLNNESVNVDVVDMSQAVIEGTSENVAIFDYASLNEYFEKYANIELDISVPTKYAKLNNDLKFYADENGYVFAGNNKYIIDNNKINVNGKLYDVGIDGTKQYVEISTENYYPVINRSGHDYLILLDTELPIVNDGNNYSVTTTNQEGMTNTSTIITYLTTSDYNPAEYINTSKPVVDVDEGDKTINFLKGDPENQNGRKIYLFTEVTWEGGYNIQVMDFNVIEEKIQITTHNDDNSINSSTNRLVIDEEEREKTISFTPGNGVYISWTPSWQSNLSKHMKFKVGSIDSPVDVDGLKITAKDLDADTNVTIGIYIGDESTPRANIEVLVKANYIFKAISSDIITNDPSADFVYKVESGERIVFDEVFWKNNFDIKNGNPDANISEIIQGLGESITPANAYHISTNGTSITTNGEKESAIYTIELTLASGKIVTKTIKFVSIPKYIIDTSALQGDVYVNNGTNLYGYITIYNYDTTLTNMFVNTNIAESVAKSDIVKFKLNGGDFDGKVDETLSPTNTLLNLTAETKPSESTESGVALNIGNVYVKGVEMYYSETGSFVDSTDYTNNKVQPKLNGNITIEVEDIANFDLSNYLQFYFAENLGGEFVYAVIKVGEEYTQTLSTEGTYDIYYAVHDVKAGFVMIGDTGYDVTIKEIVAE